MSEACSHFERVSYASLTARQKELFNFQKIAATLADYGFNCIKLADDWQGADFLAYHINRTTTLKVQLKSRLTIDGKYHHKNLWIAFPHGGYRYLLEHDRLIEKAQEHTDWLSTTSWTLKHGYSSTSINPALLKSLKEDRLGLVCGTVLATE